MQRHAAESGQLGALDQSHDDNDGNRDQRHSRERPILDELDRVKERLAKLKKQVMPLVEKGRDEIAKHYRPAVDSKVNEEIFSPASARLVRMTILATYDQGPGKGAEMATHLGRE